MFVCVKTLLALRIVLSSEVNCGLAVQTQGSCVSGTLTITGGHLRESPCLAAPESPA